MFEYSHTTNKHTRCMHARCTQTHTLRVDILYFGPDASTVISAKIHSFLFSILTLSLTMALFICVFFCFLSSIHPHVFASAIPLLPLQHIRNVMHQTHTNCTFASDWHSIRNWCIANMSRVFVYLNFLATVVVAATAILPVSYNVIELLVESAEDRSSIIGDIYARSSGSRM